VSLEGSTLRSDDGANKALYGKELSAKEIVRLGKVPPPASAQRLLAILRRASPKQREQVAPAAAGSGLRAARAVLGLFPPGMAFRPGIRDYFSANLLGT